MKHIKQFNESNVTGQFLTDLSEFCEMNLVYLMDDGLKVSVAGESRNLPSGLYSVTINYIGKDWNSIRDIMVPFFIRLDRQYRVISFDRLPAMSDIEAGRSKNQVRFYTKTGFIKSFIIDDIILDRSDFVNDLLAGIRFYVSCSEFNDVIKPFKKSIGSSIKKFLGFDDSHLR